MIQTRYLVLVIVGCLIAILFGGVFFDEQKNSVIIRPPEGVTLFGVPHDLYAVVSSPQESTGRRDELIIKVRESLGENPIIETTAPETLEAEIEIEEMISEPPQTEPSSLPNTEPITTVSSTSPHTEIITEPPTTE